MAYETETAMLAESNWTRLGYTRNQKTGLRQLTRGIKVSIDAVEASAMDYLAGIVYVDDPKANKRAYPGRWRVAEFGWQRDIGMFVQTLRYGWATSVLTGAAPNSECRVASGLNQRADARSMTLAWHSIAATAVETCMSDLRAAGSFTDPSVQGEAKTGVWAVEDVTSQMDEDGSYTITAACQKVVAVANIAALSALTPMREKVLDVDNPFGLEGGYASHVAKATKEGITLTYRALDPASRSILEALTTAQIWSLLDGSGTTPPTGDALKYEAVRGVVSNATANTLSFVAVFRYVPLATSAPESSARLVDFKLHAQSGKVHLTRSWPRLTGTAANTELMGTTGSNAKIKAETVTDPVAVGSDGVSRTYTGAWLVVDVTATETADDGVRLTQFLVKAGDQSVDVIHAPDSEHKSYEFYRWDASKTLVDAFLASSNPFGNGTLDPKWTTSEVGISKVIKVETNADRSLDLYAAYITTAGLKQVQLVAGGTPGPLTIDPSKFASQEYAWGWNVPIADLKTYSDTYKNSSTAADINKLRKFTITRRGDHTFDFEAMVETLLPIETPEYTALENDEVIIKVKEGKHLTAAQLTVNNVNVYEPPTNPVAGDTVEVVRTVEETGGVTAKRITKSEQNQESTDIVSTPFKTVTTSKQTAGDNPYTVAEGDVAQNKGAAVENALTPGGKNKGSKALTVAAPWVHPEGTAGTPPNFVVVGNVGGVFTEAVRKFKNLEAIPIAGAGELVKALENELGSFDGEHIKREIVSEASTGFKTVASSVIEWKERQGQYRIPKWTTSTDSTVPQRITGYTVVDYIQYYYRLVDVSITRIYALTHPAATAVAASVSGYTKGGGVHHINQVLELGQGLYAVENKTLTVGDWTKGDNEIVTIAST